MTDVTARPATLRDLYSVEEKVELVGGRLVKQPMTGRRAASVAERIFQSLDSHVRRTKRGEAHADGLDYTVPILRSGRESFRPDASHYEGPLPTDDEEFIHGPPTLAVEVRSQHDYGPASAREMAEKRRDYFEAGTAAVWDADSRGEIIRLYARAEPTKPTEFRRGQTAHAEPAVPGWTVGADEVFG